MAYKTTTIMKMMREIEKRQVYLPAIQRKFVWDLEKITNLMDSIMHDYPFGTFLFWRVEKDTVNKNRYVLYEFIRAYDERSNNYNRRVNLPLNTDKDDPESAITAVLDGQQRLTSLCIALNGSVTVKTSKKTKNNPNPYETKYLYFNLLTSIYLSQKQDEEGNGCVETETNAFDFLTEEEAKSQNEDGKCFWYKVKEIVGFKDLVELTTKIRTWAEIPYGNLVKLYRKIKEEQIINYFEIEDRTSMDEILDIFVRVNSAGMVLSKTELLFSTVVASWEGGREEFEEFLREINDVGNKYKFTNDFLMRAGLYLINLPTSLKVASLTDSNVNKIKENWEMIKKAIRDTVLLLNDLGFNGENIFSYNSIIPIVYYRYWFGENAFVDNSVKLEIRKYIVVAHLNQIYGRSSNSTLSIIRNEIETHIQGKDTFKLLWLQNLKFTGDATLSCSKNTIEKWFSDDNFVKGPQTFMILSLLYPDLRYKEVNFHQDHMHPYSAFDHTKELKSLKLSNGETPSNEKIKAWKRQRNTLANLQLLSGVENQSKKDKPLNEWLKTNREIAKYLPEGVSYELKDCEAFWNARRKLMVEELVKILCPDEKISDQHDTIPEGEAATQE